jgi:NIMA (never in mitosis gene a)-related kinase 2
MTQGTPTHQRSTSALQPTPRPAPSAKIPPLETPVNRPAYVDFIPSAMKGIVLTSTGESLATPSQAELVNLFNCSPKVGLNFAKIFDFEAGDHNGIPAGKRRDDEEAADSPPPSPSSRKTKEKERRKEVEGPAESSSSTSDSIGLSTATTSQVSVAVPPTRMRRPSIRTSTRPTHNRAGTLPTSASDPIFPTSTSFSAQPKPLPHPHLRHSKGNTNLASSPATMTRATAMPAGPLFQAPQRAPPEYDFTDEENLPSPFLKKSGKNSQAKAAGAVGPMANPTAPGPSTVTSTSTSSISTASRGKRRPSSGLLLRAVAASNNVERRGALSSTSTIASPVLDNGNPQIESVPAVEAGVTTDNHNGGGIPRPSLASARKAREAARKALLRA